MNHIYHIRYMMMELLLLLLLLLNEKHTKKNSTASMLSGLFFLLALSLLLPLLSALPPHSTLHTPHCTLYTSAVCVRALLLCIIRSRSWFAFFFPALRTYVLHSIIVLRLFLKKLALIWFCFACCWLFVLSKVLRILFAFLHIPYSVIKFSLLLESCTYPISMKSARASGKVRSVDRRNEGLTRTNFGSAVYGTIGMVR